LTLCIINKTSSRDLVVTVQPSNLGHGVGPLCWF